MEDKDCLERGGGCPYAYGQDMNADYHEAAAAKEEVSERQSVSESSDKQILDRGANSEHATANMGGKTAEDAILLD